VTEISLQGTDVLDFRALSTALTLNLGLSTIQTVSTNRTLVLHSVTAFENVIGGSGNDQLTGNGLANVLTGGAGNDTLAGRGGDDTLIGGRGDDNYVFNNAFAAEADTVTERPGEGTDTLNFAGLTTAVTLNLGSNTIQLIHTNRTLTLNSGSVIENVAGGSGGDILIGNALNNTFTGNGGNDVLVGNDGDDTLNGGNGRDILIGGNGRDTLLGGSDDDILIAGRTTSDSSVANLTDMLAAWTAAQPYATRIANLRSGVGDFGVSLKAKINVLDDAVADDALTGGSGTDWYLQALDDLITDLVAGEIFDLL
jgi:Ca2+-binding RTX toxin-like protein